MPISPRLREELVGQIPNLRAFAVALCGNAGRADDLVQETLVKAWANFDRFEDGTNLRAWLFTILRNEYYSQLRKSGREVEDPDGTLEARLTSPANQVDYLQFKELQSALAHLPEDQREALILVGASGMSYAEAADICGTAVGTIKSRVSRARERLVEVLGDDEQPILSKSA